jgi:hypothetical protein
MENLYTEVLISANADPVEFDNIVNRLVSAFDAKIINHARDPDTDYVDVEVQNEKLTLHRQTFIGISIFPTALDHASRQANIVVEKVVLQLKHPDK